MDREVAEIAEPSPQDNPFRRADEIIAAFKRELANALEAELKEDAAKLLRDPRVRPATPVLRKISYRGSLLDIWVPRLRMPDGELRFPPLSEKLSRDGDMAAVLREHGLPISAVPTVLERFYGERVPGTSRSNVSRADIKAGNEARAILAKRRFRDPPPIVAVSLDGTAVGTRGKKRTVMIVVGVRADGTRVLLDTFIAQFEPEKVITRRLRRLLKRGISVDVFWIADSGAGIQKALRKIEAKNVGICTVHGVRRVVKGIRDEKTVKRFRRKIKDWALSEDDHEVALARLDAVEAELRELGYVRQANSLKRHKMGMVMTQKLGLKGELRAQLRSTNVLVEGQNHTIKKNLGDVSRWKNDTMRLRWVTKRALELERDSWRRLADPKALVYLGERLGLNGLDPGAILERLPPSLTIERTATPLTPVQGVDNPGAEWLADNPDATWFGASDALAKLGVTAGTAVGTEQLARAMRGQHAVSGNTVRTFVRRRGKAPRKAKVPEMLNLTWHLTASPALMRRWRAATAEQRTELEAAFIDAARAAMEAATHSTQAGHGFAAAAVLSRPAPGAPEAESALRISGVIVGISRSPKTELKSPSREGSLSVASREGEDAAKAVLDRAFERAAPTPDLAAHPPEAPSPAVLAGVELRALGQAPRMVGTAEGLAAVAAGEAAARAGLAVACGEASGWWEANRAAAARQIAAARLASPASAKPDRWFPLTPGHRLLLGEERARELRAAAARLVGRATANADFAQELRGFDGDPLARLETAVGRVDDLAEAIAARREIERRALFETLGAAGSDGEPPPAVRVRDSRGTPAKPPVERNQRALGRHAIALRRYAAALGPLVAKLRPRQLGRLLGAAGKPWRAFDPNAAFRHARLEERREAGLKELLRAEYHAGFDLEKAKLAEAKRDAGAAFEASGGRHKAEAKRLRGELARIDQEIDDARRQGEGLETERLVRDHPEAAVYDAAFAEAQRRELSRAREPTEVGMDVGL